jgi:hypothetical protein
MINDWPAHNVAYSAPNIETVSSDEVESEDRIGVRLAILASTPVAANAPNKNRKIAGLNPGFAFYV